METDSNKIILEPIVTEKTNAMREKHRYVFRVDPRANKLQIMQAVRDLFKVHPLACNVINVKGKPKRQRYTPGYTASWKKAIITLPASEKITVFEGA
jgi:large subunit ribosomal protein L23